MPDTGPRHGSFCTGYGGLDIATQNVYGGTLAWTCDIDPGAAQIINHRMPGTPNLGDLTTTNWQAVLDEYGPVDIVTGGYPCQPFSVAGQRKGTEDDRHIWPYIADALRVLRPRYAIFENVAGHLRLGFDTVLADLARLGFDAEWCLVRASEVGAPHQRQRLFLLATAADTTDLGHERGRSTWGRGHGPADHRDPASHTGHRNQPERPRPARREDGERASVGSLSGCSGGVPGRGHDAADTDGSGWWGGPGLVSRVRPQERVESDQPRRNWGKYASAIGRWEHRTGRRAPWATDARNRLSPAFVEWLMGLPAGHVTDVPDLTRTQQLKALGNGVVPQQAEAAIRLLHQRAAA